jgi:hypothetical protein
MYLGLTKTIISNLYMQTEILVSGRSFICFVLFRFVLFCFVLFCFVLFYFMLFDNTAYITRKSG